HSWQRRTLGWVGPRHGGEPRRWPSPPARWLDEARAVAVTRTQGDHPDVDHRGAPHGADRRVRHRRRGHRQPGGPGRPALRAYRQPDRAPEDPREGLPLAPRPADAGRPPPPAARLPEGERHQALRNPDRAPEP